MGAPRSGTTLLRNTLNRHPRIALCRETDFYHYIYRRRGAFGPLAERRNREHVVREYLALERIRRTRLDLDQLAQCLLEEAESYPALLSSLLRFYMRTHGKQRWGEKTPTNSLFAETLLGWFEGATLIHVLRDPLDVVASLMQVPWSGDNALGNANLWRSFNRAASRAHDRPGYVLLRYETFVADPEAELRRICGVIGEDFSPQMLQPKPDPTADRPWFQRAERPVERSAVGSWRGRLTEQDAQLVEWFLGSEMESFGYERIMKPPSWTTIAAGFAFGVKDAIRRRAGEFPALWYGRAGCTQIAREEAAASRYHDRILRQSASQW